MPFIPHTAEEVDAERVDTLGLRLDQAYKEVER